MYTLCHLKAKNKITKCFLTSCFYWRYENVHACKKKRKKKVPALIGNEYKYITRNKTCWKKKTFLIQSIFQSHLLFCILRYTPDLECEPRSSFKNRTWNFPHFQWALLLHVGQVLIFCLGSGASWPPVVPCDTRAALCSSKSQKLHSVTLVFFVFFWFTINMSWKLNQWFSCGITLPTCPQLFV